jgi:hypothetical protein
LYARFTKSNSDYDSAFFPYRTPTSQILAKIYYHNSARIAPSKNYDRSSAKFQWSCQQRPQLGRRQNELLQAAPEFTTIRTRTPHGSQKPLPSQFGQKYDINSARNTWAIVLIALAFGSLVLLEWCKVSDYRRHSCCLAHSVMAITTLLLGCNRNTALHVGCVSVTITPTHNHLLAAKTASQVFANCPAFWNDRTTCGCCVSPYSFTSLCKLPSLLERLNHLLLCVSIPFPIFNHDHGLQCLPYEPVDSSSLTITGAVANCVSRLLALDT